MTSIASNNFESIQPFFKIALQAGASSGLLNPNNDGQGRVSTYFGKPLRAIARLVYGIASVSIIPTLGALYHTVKAIDCFVTPSATTDNLESSRSKSWKHLKAAGQDAFLSLSTILLCFIAVKTFAFSRTLHDGDRAGVGFGLSFTSGTAALAIPITFTFVPSTFSDW